MKLYALIFLGTICALIAILFARMYIVNINVNSKLSDVCELMVTKNYSNEDICSWNNGDIILFNYNVDTVSSKTTEYVTQKLLKCETPHTGMIIKDDQNNVGIICYRRTERILPLSIDQYQIIDRKWHLVPWKNFSKNVQSQIIRLPCAKQVSTIDILKALTFFGNRKYDKKVYLNLFYSWREKVFNKNCLMCSNALLILCDQLNLIDLTNLIAYHSKKNMNEIFNQLNPCTFANANFRQNFFIGYSSPYKMIK